MKLYRISGYILLIFLLFSCKGEDRNQEKSSRVGALPYYNEATFTPNWLKTNDLKLKNFHKIPSFEFVNQDSIEISEETFRDKVYVADFFFTTCPGICPKMTKNMALVQEAFTEDDGVLLISHSVTPTIDSVAVLREYANERGINSKKWHLVTGNKKEIYDLGRYAYFVEEDLGKTKTEDDFLHTENFILIDKNKHIRGIYNGLNKSSVNQLIADIKALKLEG